MKRSLIIVPLSLAVGLATFGCGGSGGGGNNNNPTSIDGNSFVGAYTMGEVVDLVKPAVSSHTTTSAPETGEAGINISTTGVISGRFVDAGPNNPGTGTLSGQVTLNTGSTTAGTISITSDRSGTTDTYTGSVVLTNGLLTGTVADNSNNTILFQTGFAIVTGNSNPYVGFYNGTFTYDNSSPTQVPPDTLDLVIDNSGNVTAYAVNNTASPVESTVQTGTISSSGNASGTLSLSPQGTTGKTASGQLTLSGGVLSGTITDSSSTPVTKIGITVVQNS